MPYIHILVNKPHANEVKARLMHAVSGALTQSMGAPLSSIRVNILPLASHDTMVAGVIGPEIVEVHIYWIAGRTVEQKEAALMAVNQAVHETLDVPADLCRTVIHEIPTTDLGVAGGISAKRAGR